MKTLKWFILFAIMAALLTGCNESTQQTAPEVRETVTIYRNVDGADYRGQPEEVPVRTPDAEGRYYILFAAEGEQQRLQVHKSVIERGIDMHDLLGLVIDENGVVTDFYPIEECSGGYFIDRYYVEKIEGSKVVCNNAPKFNGYRVEFTVTDDLPIWLDDGNSPLTGTATQIQENDIITVIADHYSRPSMVYVTHMGVVPDVYWNITRQYDSANKTTLRTTDEYGYYVFDLTEKGSPVTVKTKDKAVADAMDRYPARNMVLTFDEEGFVTRAAEGSTVTGGYFASWCSVTTLKDNQLICTRLLSGSDKGVVYKGITSGDFVAYDVSGQADVMGEETTLRKGDTVHCLTNQLGQVCIAFVINRIPDTPLYWNVDRRYDAETKETTRYMWSDGYYHVIVAVNGKQQVIRVPNRELVNAMDKRAEQHFGLKLDGDIVRAVYTPSQATGGTYFASWCDVTKIEDNMVTAVRTLSGDDQGTYYTGKMAADCKVYNVSSSADTVGEETTLQVGDRIHGQTNMDGELIVIYVVGNRTRNATKLYWNIDRMYNSTTQQSTRTPDADGWYTFLLACEGQQVTVRTQDKDIAQKMDAKADHQFGLRVNKEGVITMYCSSKDVVGGTYFASWCDVTQIDGDRVTALRNLSGDDQGTSYRAKLAPECKVYNVSSNYVSYVGEETKLRVGDRIHGQCNIYGALLVVFVVDRPDIATEPDHFHCACNGTAKGVGSHSCDDAAGWSAWVNTKKLPTSGNWYLTVDVTVTGGTTIPAGSTLNICLNGHKIHRTSGSGSVFNVNTGLTITDCRDSGKIISSCDAYGSVLYINENQTAAEVNLFAGTLENTLSATGKDGGIIYIGYNGTYRATLNMYGGQINGQNVGSCSGGAINIIHGNVFNMYGGLINGGSAKKGGAVCVANGAFNMYGGTVQKGSATDGGNIHINKATFSMYGGAVTQGTATNEGGNICLYSASGLISVYGGEITDGSAKNGGNMMLFGNLQLYGGAVENGTATSFGGNICTWSSPTITMEAGTVQNGSARTGADIVLRGTAPKLIAPSGKIGCLDTINGSVTVSGTTVMEKLHLAGGTVVAENLLSGASIAISMATPGPFITNCTDLTQFFHAADNSFQVLFDGNNMCLTAKLRGIEPR